VSNISIINDEENSYAEHLSSPTVFIGVYVARSVVFCVMLYRSLLVIVVSVLLPITSSDYPFGIFKRFYLTSLAYKRVALGNWTCYS